MPAFVHETAAKEWRGVVVVVKGPNFPREFPHSVVQGYWAFALSAFANRLAAEVIILMFYTVLPISSWHLQYS